ncbi:hypothetical protein GCM10023093_09940 [Nemorincola caseinilytica]|uniref:Dihydroneopterin aldolase/epimerase domain-containing protein n=1 Tax=Nemorincola caseinilytica TaxID=2054315 RepID=A0ABP8N7R3_9BACT
MLTVSLHKIVVKAPIGLYPEEWTRDNTFETDVDIWLPDAQPWPFADYSLMHKAVHDVFAIPGQRLLETLVQGIHAATYELFPMAQKVRIAVRKMHPPLAGEVGYSQVCYEM